MGHYGAKSDGLVREMGRGNGTDRQAGSSGDHRTGLLALWHLPGRWGGVVKEFWYKVARENTYGWDIDPESIEMMDDTIHEIAIQRLYAQKQMKNEMNINMKGTNGWKGYNNNARVKFCPT